MNDRSGSIVISHKAKKILCDYLRTHERDIAYGIYDFRDLTVLFIDCIGREPSKKA